MTALRLHTVDPCHDPRWERLMRGPDASLFGSPPWLRAVAGTYGFELTARILVDHAGEPHAGFAYTEIDDVRGRRRSSLPFGDRLDPVLRDDAQWPVLAEPFLAGSTDGSLRVLDCDAPKHDARLFEHHTLAWHSTDLTRPLEQILAEAESRVRTNLRVAARRGAVVSVGSSLDHVRQFHALHRYTRKYKYRLLAQPFAFFEAIWHEFAPDDAIDVALVTLDGAPIAGALYLRWNDTYYYKFGASITDGLRVRPNECAHWAGIERGHERGCRLFDWGVSDLDQPGLIRYKRKFATDERSVSVLRRVDPEGQPAAAVQASGLLGRLTELLTETDVPDDVSARAGELLYRYFA